VTCRPGTHRRALGRSSGRAVWHGRAGKPVVGVDSPSWSHLRGVPRPARVRGPPGAALRRAGSPPAGTPALYRVEAIAMNSVARNLSDARRRAGEAYDKVAKLPRARLSRRTHHRPSSRIAAILCAFRFAPPMPESHVLESSFVPSRPSWRASSRRTVAPADSCSRRRLSSFQRRSSTSLVRKTSRGVARERSHDRPRWGRRREQRASPRRSAKHARRVRSRSSRRPWRTARQRRDEDSPSPVSGAIPMVRRPTADSRKPSHRLP